MLQIRTIKTHSLALKYVLQLSSLPLHAHLNQAGNIFMILRHFSFVVAHTDAVITVFRLEIGLCCRHVLCP